VAHPGLKKSRLASAIAGLVLAACATPTPAPAPPPSRATSAEPIVVFSEHAWETVVSPRFFLAFPIPDAAEWRIDDKSGRWLAAAHLPTKSMLWVRAWREGSVVGHRACEAVARSYRPDLFGRDETVLVDRRPLGVPAGFDTEVGFTVSRNKGALGAVAAAIGARVRQCLVIVYATRADGPDAEQVVAERIGFVVDRIFSRVESRSIDDRVAPEVGTGK
jgi:hypothetical protein